MDAQVASIASLMSPNRTKQYCLGIEYLGCYSSLTVVVAWNVGVCLAGLIWLQLSVPHKQSVGVMVSETVHLPSGRG